MAKRFALEGLEVMVGARVAASAVAQLPTSVKGPSSVLVYLTILKNSIMLLFFFFVI